MKQNTPQWLEYRKTKIGASDASAIMGVSPWSSPYDLWLEKMGMAPEKTMTPAMQRGIDLQDKALDCFAKMTGLDTFPDVKVHPKYDFMIASLDGITLDGHAIVEVKCPGQKTHEIASLYNRVPDHYIPQLQHQMEVCGHDRIYYFSFDGENGVVIQVLRDDSYIKELLEKETAFWYCMQNGIPPAMIERDSTKRTDIEWQIMAEEWRGCKTALHDLEVLEEKWRQRLIEACDGKNCYGAGVSVTKSAKKNKSGESTLSWRITKSGEEWTTKSS